MNRKRTKQLKKLQKVNSNNLNLILPYHILNPTLPTYLRREGSTLVSRRGGGRKGALVNQHSNNLNIILPYHILKLIPYSTRMVLTYLLTYAYGRSDKLQ